MENQSINDMSTQYYTLNGYKIDKYSEIGRGQQGIILNCLKLNTNEQLIVKVVTINELQQIQCDREKDIVRKLNNSEYCCNIVKIYDVFIVKEQENSYFFQFMERCDSDLGKIMKELQYQQKYLTQAEILNFARQFVNGYHKLRELDIFHRDIKPENILIKYEEGNPIYKITDLGLSKDISKDYAITQGVGTPLYVGPEVLLAQGYTTSSDIYSFGMILYQLTYNFQKPNNIKNKQDVFNFHKLLKDNQFILQPKEGIEQDLIDLIQKMLIYSPNQRIDWLEIEQHQYFQDTFKQHQIKKSQISYYHEYLIAVFLQSNKIINTLNKCPTTHIWQQLTIQILSMLIYSLQDEIGIIINSLIKNENKLRQSISCIKQIQNVEHQQLRENILSFLQKSNINLQDLQKEQQIFKCKQEIEELLKNNEVDYFFTNFYNNIYKKNQTQECDRFDTCLFQFSIVFKEFLQPWIMKYFSQKSIQLKEVYEIVKFSHLLEEYPKKIFDQFQIKQIESKILTISQMEQYLKLKELI